MAVNKLAPNTDVQPTIPAGTYDGRIIRAEVRTLTIRKDTPKAEDIEFIDLGVLVQTPEDANGHVGTQIVSTSPFNDHTRTAAQSGSKAVKFLKQLGFADPVNDGFDLESLMNADVTVTVAYQMGKDGIPRNWVKDIALKQ